MIFDAVPYRDTLESADIRSRARRTLTDYMEKNLGVKIVKDLRNIPFSRPDLEEPLRLATLLKEAGVIQSLGRVSYSPDDPRMWGWYAICNDTTDHMANGYSWDSDQGALYAALAEALERYIWFTQDDYFTGKVRATTEQIAEYGRHVAPQSFVGFTNEQREKYPRRRLRPDAEYLWIQGTSLTQGGSVYIPAQTVSCSSLNWQGSKEEPLIRQRNTNGLATWPTQNGARLGGVLELIERDAYMIMWFNQLTLPRIALSPLLAQSQTLRRAVALCERYQFRTHVIQLPTDAPVHAVAVIMEDVSGNAPRFTIGLNAHTSLTHAIEKAMAEAIRANRLCRQWMSAGNQWDVSTPIEKIGHMDRVYYWAVPEHSKHLEFMVQGPEIEIQKSPWDNDSTKEHLQRIIKWCKDKDYECISVPLTSSEKNPTHLHIEMMVIPELQPTYLNESVQQFGGDRWHDVPKALGYTPRKKPFGERPHPFL